NEAAARAVRLIGIRLPRGFRPSPPRQCGPPAGGLPPTSPTQAGNGTATTQPPPPLRPPDSSPATLSAPPPRALPPPPDGPLLFPPAPKPPLPGGTPCGISRRRHRIPGAAHVDAEGAAAVLPPARDRGADPGRRDRRRLGGARSAAAGEPLHDRLRRHRL